MAFPTGWSRKAAVTIDATQVSGSAATHADLPVLLTTANLPSEMFDRDGTYPAQNGGGDIRFSSDSAGASPIPCHVIKFVTHDTPASGEAVVYVAVDVLSDTDTTIYVWYNTSAHLEQPKYNVNTDTDGFQGSDYVWANYQQIFALGGFGGWRNLKQANASKNIGRYDSGTDTRLTTVAAGGTNVYNSFPSLVKVGDDLYCAHRAATTHALSVNGNVDIRVSGDIGRTWAKDTGLSITDASWDLRDPQLLLDDDDKLWLFYTKTNAGDTVRTTVYRTSSSPYSSWSAESSAIHTGTKSQVAGKPIQLRSGRICVPMYDIDGSGNTFPFVSWSDNDFSSYTEDFLTATGAAGTYANHNEFSIAENPTTAGTVVAIIRENSDGNLQRSASTDSCQTWSTFTDEIPITGTYPDMPEIQYTQDGDLVCAFGYDRSNAEFRLIRSTDDGLTWDAQNSFVRNGINPSGLTREGGYLSFVEFTKGNFVVVFYHDNSATDGAVFSTYVSKVEDGALNYWTETDNTTAGKIDDAYSMDDTQNSNGNASLDWFNQVHNGGAFTISGWAKFNQTSDDTFCFAGSTVTNSDRGFFFAYENRTAASSPDALRLFSANGSGTSVNNQSSAISCDTNAHRFGVFADAGGTPTFIDGSTTYAGSTGMPTYTGDAEQETRIGGSAYTTSDFSSFRLDGWMEMWGFSTVNLGADYEKTRYANENAPGTFATAGAPSAVGGAVTITPNAATQAHAAAQPSITQAHSIAPGDATHAHTVDQPAISTLSVLVPADATQAHTAEQPAIVQAHVIAVASATQAHTAEGVTLTVGGSIAPDGALHGQLVESPVIAQAGVLLPDSAAQAHAVDQPTITQAHSIAPADALHAQTAAAATLDLSVVVSPADALQAQTAEAPVLTQSHLVAVADALHAHLADVASLSQHYTIVASDALHAHLAASPAVVLGTLETPAGRVFLIRATARVFLIT